MTDGGAGEGKGGLISTEYGLASCLFSSVENEQQRREHNMFIVFVSKIGKKSN